MNKPKVSIIIPVFNAEKYLERCLKSVLDQKFTDFEVIIVNDGSQDSSISILSVYLQRDNRIKLINNAKNKGVSVARNMGLEHAEGEFVLFVDADDYLDIDYIDSYFSIGSTNFHNSLVIQGCSWYYKGKARKYICKRGVYCKENFSEALSEYEMFRHGSPYGKLYSTQIIKSYNIQFNSKVTNYEDLLFFLDYIVYVDKLVFIDNTGYHYNVFDGGLHSKDSGIDGEKLLLELYIKKTKPYWTFSKSKVSSYTKILLIRVLYTMKKYLNETELPHAIKLLINEYSFIFKLSNEGIRKKNVIFLFFIKNKLFKFAFASHRFIDGLTKIRHAFI